MGEIGVEVLFELLVLGDGVAVEFEQCGWWARPAAGCGVHGYQMLSFDGRPAVLAARDPVATVMLLRGIVVNWA